MLSIVIPCYNEAVVIEKSVDKVIDFMKSIKVDYELLLINDGSTDNSKEVFDKINLKYEVVKPYSYDKNRGKGYAVNYGFKKSIGDIVLFMDADLATDLNSINDVLEIALTRKDSYCIIGSRKMKGSLILNNNNRVRKIMSKYCTIFVNKLFKLNVSDSQCGFKCFDRKTANYLAKNQTVYGWAFDAEFILLMRRSNIDVIEIPVIWENEKRSSVSPIKSSIVYIREMIKIKRLYK